MNGRSRILAGGLVGFAAIALVAILLRASWSGAPSARVAEAQPTPAPAITLVGPDEAPAHDADAESPGGVEVKPSDEEASATEPDTVAAVWAATSAGAHSSATTAHISKMDRADTEKE